MNRKTQTLKEMLPPRMMLCVYVDVVIQGSSYCENSKSLMRPFIDMDALLWFVKELLVPGLVIPELRWVPLQNGYGRRYTCLQVITNSWCRSGLKCNFFRLL